MTLASASSRYLFDLDFDAEHRAKDEAEAVPTISLYEHEAQMAALERRVRAEAHAAGHAEAMAQGATKLAEETRNLTTVAKTLLSRLDTEIGMREERAVRIAVSAAKKLARRLLEAEPIGEVEMLFRACLAPMFDASHLVVRMGADNLDAVRQRLETIASEQGFEGRLIFLGEDGFASGDARIDWADGGLARSQHEIEAAIDRLVADYLAARAGTGPDLPATSQTQAMKAAMESALDD